MIADKPVGTVLYKTFDFDDEPVAFDMFVMTNKGWVCVDQNGIQPGCLPVGVGYAECVIGDPAKVSGAA